MVKKLILFFVFFVITLIAARANENYIINGDRVFINDSNVFLDAFPHTVRFSDTPVEFELINKVKNMSVDIYLGVNTNMIRPKNAFYYNSQNISKTETKMYKGYYSFNITNTALTCEIGDADSLFKKNAWFYTCNNINNCSTPINKILCFDSFVDGDIEDTIYWNVTNIEFVEWQKIKEGSLDVINYDYASLNKWYHLDNFFTIKDKSYKAKLSFDIINNNYYKYWLCVKPNDETIGQAISNNHFYCLDPWVEGATLRSGNVVYYGFNADNFSNLNGQGNDALNISTVNSSGKILDGRNFTSGDNKYINTTVLTPTGNFSWTGWFSLDSWSGNQILISSDQFNGGWDSIQINRHDAGNISITSCSNEQVSNFSPSLQSWFFLTVTRSDNDWKLYVNGSLRKNFTLLCSPVQRHVLIGRNNDATYPRNHVGLVDEFGWWNRSLSQAEIETLYYDGVGLAYPFDTNTAPTTTITYNTNNSDTGKLTLHNNINWSINTSDAEGNSVNQTWNVTLYNSDWTYNQTLGNGTNSSNNFSILLTNNTWRKNQYLNLTVNATDGTANTLTVASVQVSNAPPTRVNITYPNSSVSVEKTINITYSMVDPDGDALSTANVSLLNLNGVFNTSINASATLTYQTWNSITGFIDQNYTIRIIACDSGSSGSDCVQDEQNFSLDNNNRPTLTLLYPLNNSATLDSWIEFNWTDSDPDVIKSESSDTIYYTILLWENGSTNVSSFTGSDPTDNNNIIRILIGNSIINARTYYYNISVNDSELTINSSNHYFTYTPSLSNPGLSGGGSEPFSVANLNETNTSINDKSEFNLQLMSPELQKTLVLVLIGFLVLGGAGLLFYAITKANL
ncbi:MAG TPA: LamG-like jellyroll fold domain-containing protein [Gammaproteobacteria bacterium]|nr:LamG-like jellyroll fold domain-containing protein [Gammaproteobacteria bacterium]